MLADYEPRVVRHIFGGFPFLVCIGDPLAEGWYDHDWDPPFEIETLKKGKLREGATVFELGAHQCVVALMLARVVGKAGSVVAIEANAHNFRAGQKNKDLNDAAQLQVLYGAVSDVSGDIVFNRALNGQVDDGEGSYGRDVVKAYSVDDLAAKYGVPDVLFIDVEGYECQALRGANRTLANSPDCFIEVHVSCGLEKLGGSLVELISNFPPHSYRLLMGSDTNPSFVPFDTASSMVLDRFYLVALAASN
jgi:FkbM family methyltransferase